MFYLPPPPHNPLSLATGEVFISNPSIGSTDTRLLSGVFLSPISLMDQIEQFLVLVQNFLLAWAIIVKMANAGFANSRKLSFWMKQLSAALWNTRNWGYMEMSGYNFTVEQ